MNPIGYDLLYDFSDKSVVQAFINDTRSMKAAYEEFVQVVIGGQLSSLAKQEEELAKKIREVAEASAAASVTNKATQDQLIAQAAAIADLTKQLELLKATRTSTKQVEDAAANSVDGLTKKLAEQLAEYKKLDPAVESNFQRLTTLSNGIRQTREAITQLTNETKLSTQTFTAAKGSYQALEQETKQLVKDLKLMEGGLDANNTRAKELQKTIFENTARLKTFDAQMNQNFRNVGNYGSALQGAGRQFDGLGNSIQQIGRELPSVAVSLNTFFLAISNNLPILFDELQRTKTAIEEAKAASILAADAAAIQAKETAVAAGAIEAEAVALGNQARAQALANAEQSATPSIAKRVLSSIFSINTALTLAVVGLTLFGGKIIEAFTGVGEATKKAAEANKKYQESIQEIDRTSQAAADTEVARITLLTRTAANVNVAMEQRIAAIDELKKRFPEYFSNLEREAFLNGRAASAIRDATSAIFAKAASEASLDKFKTASKRVSDLNDNLDKTNRSIADLNRNANLVDLKKATDAAKAFQDALDKKGGKATGEEENQRTRLLLNLAAASAKVNVAEVENLKKLESAQFAYSAQLNEAKIEQQNFYFDAQKSGETVSKINDKLLGTGRTPSRIKKELEDVRRQLDFVNVTDARHNQLLKDERKLQDELSAAQGKESQTSKENKKAAREAETEYQKQLRLRLQVINANEKAELAEADLAFQLTQKTVSDEIRFEEERLAIITKFANEKLALYPKDSKQYIDASAEKTKAESEEIEKIKDLREKFRKQDLEATENFNQRLQQVRDNARELMESEKAKSFTQAENVIQLRVISGQITQPEGEKALFELRKRQQEELIALDRKKYRESIEGSEEEVAAKKQLNADELQSERDTINEEIRLRELATRRRVELTNFISDLVTTVAQGIFDNNQQARDNESAELSKQKDYELKIAGDNKDAQQKINENFAIKQAELKTKQAQQAKNEALYNIAISTAEAVAKSVAATPETFGLPFSAFALALGIAQAAIVSARPLPKYRFGRGKGKTEFAEVNDGEGFEFIERNGELRVEGGGRRTVTKLDAQDRVFTHRESMQLLKEDFKDKKASDSWMNSLLAGTGVYMRAEERKNQRLAAALSSGMDQRSLSKSFKEAVDGIPVQMNIFDENGFRAFSRNKNTLIENVNRRQKLGGNG